MSEKEKYPLPEPELQTREAVAPRVLEHGKEFRSAIRKTGATDMVLVYECLAGIYDELVGFIERAKLGVRRDVYNRSEKKYESVNVPREGDVIRGLSEMRELMMALVNVRKQVKEEQKGIPRWLVDAIQKSLEPYPEARKALLEAVENPK